MSETMFRTAIEYIGLSIDSFRQKGDIPGAAGSAHRLFTWITAHDQIGKRYEFFFNQQQSRAGALTVQDIVAWARSEMTDEWQQKWQDEAKT